MNLFKAAPFWEGAGASDGGEEIAEGVTEGTPAGESEGDNGGDGGESTEVGEGDGAFTVGAGGEDDGDTAEGEIAGEGDFCGVASTGVRFGDRAGEDAGDWATTEVTNNAATSVNKTVELAIIGR